MMPKRRRKLPNPPSTKPPRPEPAAGPRPISDAGTDYTIDASVDVDNPPDPVLLPRPSGPAAVPGPQVGAPSAVQESEGERSPASSTR